MRYYILTSDMRSDIQSWRSHKSGTYSLPELLETVKRRDCSCPFGRRMAHAAHLERLAALIILDIWTRSSGRVYL